MCAIQMEDLKDTSDSTLSSDELMLKELERRDGIYSFIFHELEAPKSKTATKEATTSELQKKLYVLDAKAAAAAAQVPVVSSCTSSKAPRSIPSISTLRKVNTSASKHYYEFLHAWYQPTPPPPPPPPPHPLFYEHQRLYSYRPGRSREVRVHKPRFSHLVEPLVRNRRHLLKDTPEYKKCETFVVNAPDLRSLFPHDPDVHAPFCGGRQWCSRTGVDGNNRCWK